MRKLALVLVTTLTMSSVAHQAVASDWRTDFQIHKDDYERTHPKGGYFTDEPSAECGLPCRVVTGGILLSILVIAAAENAKRVAQQRQIGAR